MDIELEDFVGRCFEEEGISVERVEERRILSRMTVSILVHFRYGDETKATKFQISEEALLEDESILEEEARHRARTITESQSEVVPHDGTTIRVRPYESGSAECLVCGATFELSEIPHHDERSLVAGAGVRFEQATSPDYDIEYKESPPTRDISRLKRDALMMYMVGKTRQQCDPMCGNMDRKI